MEIRQPHPYEENIPVASVENTLNDKMDNYTHMWTTSLRKTSILTLWTTTPIYNVDKAPLWTLLHGQHLYANTTPIDVDTSPACTAHHYGHYSLV